MLLKKIDRGQLFLKEQLALFRCPKCHERMISADAYQLKCQTNHQYDLSKKGTLNFLAHPIKTDYDREMLSHRQKMIQAGLYQPLLEKVKAILAEESLSTLVDMGCGEGSFLNGLAQLGVGGTKIGFDISKDGVGLATEQDVPAFWCVADMTNLPFNDQQLSHVLNIFSPSHYGEFRRVLKSGGKVIKIVPEANYLIELRQAFYEDKQEKQHYSNEKVVRKFSEELRMISEERVTYQFEVSDNLQQALLKMSPLHWGASADSLEKVATNFIKKITIDLLILVGEK